MKIKNKWLGYLIGTIVTIFLGAIGSGLWEVFLSGFLYDLINLFLRFSSFIFKGYGDILHEGISNGPTEVFSLIPYTITVLVLCIFPWVLMFVFKILINKIEEKLADTEEPSESVSRDELLKMQEELLERREKLREETLSIKRIVKYLFPFLGVLTILIYFTIVASDLYQYKASIFIEKSIEIVSPKIAQKEILNLRSLYRSIDNATSFYNLEKKLLKIASENDLELPKFSPIN